jgi:hypothetical protein
MSAARGRESAAAWLADPAGTAVESGTRIQLMGRMADAYCRALMSARRAANVPLPEPPPAAAAPPSPTAPEEEDIILKPTEDPPPPPASPLPIEAATPNVESPKAAVPSPPPKTVARAASRLHPQFLKDLEIVQRLQRALEGPKPSPPAWEVHALVSPRPAALPGQIAELERLRHSGKPGEFAGAAYAMREKIREAKSRHEVLAEKLRSYLEKIFNGWQGEAEEIAFAVLLGSANGRQRAELWLREPGLSMNEARVLVESFVDRAREHLEKGGKVATGS